MSYTEHHAFFSAPAAPVGTVGEGPLVMHGAYTEQITRKLSAAAFVRRGLGRLPARRGQEGLEAAEVEGSALAAVAAPASCRAG
ncbi:hypothetical protein [Streptomyces sp. KL116D]|uniref:hypothetical protein n=1 Tax=Streptomyces sp. KL116D TaxID=3045152 RepID=UPI0035591A4E